MLCVLSKELFNGGSEFMNGCSSVGACSRAAVYHVPNVLIVDCFPTTQRI